MKNNFGNSTFVLATFFAFSCTSTFAADPEDFRVVRSSAARHSNVDVSTGSRRGARGSSANVGVMNAPVKKPTQADVKGLEKGIRDMATVKAWGAEKGFLDSLDSLTPEQSARMKFLKLKYSQINNITPWGNTPEANGEALSEEWTKGSFAANKYVKTEDFARLDDKDRARVEFAAPIAKKLGMERSGYASMGKAGAEPSQASADTKSSPVPTSTASSKTSSHGGGHTPEKTPETSVADKSSDSAAPETKTAAAEVGVKAPAPEIGSGETVDQAYLEKNYQEMSLAGDSKRKLYMNPESGSIWETQASGVKMVGQANGADIKMWDGTEAAVTNPFELQLQSERAKNGIYSNERKDMQARYDTKAGEAKGELGSFNLGNSWDRAQEARGIKKDFNNQYADYDNAGASDRLKILEQGENMENRIRELQEGPAGFNLGLSGYTRSERTDASMELMELQTQYSEFKEANASILGGGEQESSASNQNASAPEKGPSPASENSGMNVATNAGAAAGLAGVSAAVGAANAASTGATNVSTPTTK